MLEKLIKLAMLDGRDVATIFLAMVTLPMVVFGLRIFGFGRVYAVLFRKARECEIGQESRVADPGALRLARLVSLAARYGLHRANCLPMSLTLGWILGLHGISSDLRIGVRKSGARIEAHAWIEHRGMPLIDSGDVHHRFAAFDPLALPLPSRAK